MGDHVLFFYGTLMSPQILHRVIHGRADPEPWQKATLHIQPAILHGYRRHRVRNADYPGITPIAETTSGTENSLATSVVGTLVSGLTDGDVHRLDMFEGDQYERMAVVVRTLHRSQGKDDSHTASESGLRDVLDAVGEAAGEGEEVEAVTYVWTAEEDLLEDAEWDLESFKRDKMAWWVEADESQW
ncbi:uncharacterized protein N7515_000968 [Penicillium bovifimosum]|uniref:Putative gamma-glutamylcyclotransferase n=1 Tax=Penicillium bovifimosum TaxID=126998 RepID=A0A9W9HH24_9EURO|nr:uncharacterized protein N7515_000968 [Penicillium bovifimosum]KAJ5146404.1 hypothetical protein N7515_000968 [Penicillium bovifimosum]